MKILKTSRKHFFDDFPLFGVRFFDFRKKRKKKKRLTLIDSFAIYFKFHKSSEQVGKSSFQFEV